MNHSNESFTEQHFPLILFIMLYKVIRVWMKSLKCDHSNERYATEQNFLEVLSIFLCKLFPIIQMQATCII